MPVTQQAAGALHAKAGHSHQAELASSHVLSTIDLFSLLTGTQHVPL